LIPTFRISPKNASVLSQKDSRRGAVGDFHLHSLRRSLRTWHCTATTPRQHIIVTATLRRRTVLAVGLPFGQYVDGQRIRDDRGDCQHSQTADDGDQQRLPPAHIHPRHIQPLWRAKTATGKLAHEETEDAIATCSPDRRAISSTARCTAHPADCARRHEAQCGSFSERDNFIDSIAARVMSRSAAAARTHGAKAQRHRASARKQSCTARCTWYNGNSQK
jgi:hypothetical protein